MATTIQNTVFNYESLKNKYNGINTVPINELSRKILGGSDSIHDFFDKGGRVPLYAWPSVNTLLKEKLKSLQTHKGSLSNTTPKDNDFYNDWLRSSSNNSITAVSQVEDQTVAWFESSYPEELKISYTRILTYRTIIATINNFKKKGLSINESIYEAGKELFDDITSNYHYVLDIDLETGEDWNRDYSVQDKICIGVFMLNFFFPPTNPDDNTTTPTYITFDANSNIPSKIFGLLDQTVNLVTPMNIADSATTGESHLSIDKSQKRAGVKNKYSFPNQTSAPDANEYTYTSNLYTSNKIVLSKKNRDAVYDEITKYDFNIKINTTIAMNFNNDEKSGPSVTYLSNLISNPQTSSPENKMVNLNKYVSNLKSLDNKSILLDLKRSGDWEQCNSAYVINNNGVSPLKGRVILCSLDRLCALYSRCIGQSTIWHNGTHMKLYRYPKPLSRSEQDALLLSIQSAKSAKDREAETILTRLLKYLQEKIDYFNTQTMNDIGVTGINGGSSINSWIISIANQLLRKSIIFLRELIENNNSQILLINNTNITFSTILKKLLTDISISSGQAINILNFEPFFETFNNFTLNKTTNKLDKGKFLYYEYAFIISLRDALTPIINFDPIRVGRSINIKNYKDDFFKTGFPLLEKLAELFPDYQSLIDGITSITFNSSYELSRANMEYYTKLQQKINTTVPIIVGSMQTTTIGGTPRNKRQRFSREEEQIMQNVRNKRQRIIPEDEQIMQNLESDLTNEFILFCSDLNEITIGTIKKIQEPAVTTIFDSIQNMFTPGNSETNQSSSPTFFDYMASINENPQILNQMDIWRTIDTFLDNSYKLLINARELYTTIDEFNYYCSNVVNTYLEIYLFLACLYVDIPIDKNEIKVALETRNNIYFTGENKETLFGFRKFLFEDFFNEYLIKKEDLINNDYSYIDEKKNSLYFIMQSGFKLRKEYGSVSILIMSFSFVDLFKNIIKTRHDDVNASDYGYYPSMFPLYKKLEKISTSKYYWEYEQNVKVYRHFYEFINTLVANEFNPEKAITLANSYLKLQWNASGGKRLTKKNGNKKIKNKKTRNNKTQ